MLILRRVTAPLLSVCLFAALPVTTGCTGLMPVAAQVPALEARPGCSLWSGASHGNDPSARIELELCPVDPRGESVAGRVQFTSPRSGWSVREVQGRISPDGVLYLRDVKFDVNMPEFGWAFCLVDGYELVSSGSVAAGHYDSRACYDHAAIELRRM